MQQAPNNVIFKGSIGKILCFLVCLALNTFTVMAVSQVRITKPIDPAQVSVVSGSVPLAALRATDLGLVESNFPLSDLTLRFNISAAQQTALGQLLKDQQDKRSPLYHHWLTPEGFASQFGLSPSDLQTISAWLISQGFIVKTVARGGLFIRFSGTVGQVQTAFHTPIHRLKFNGQEHIGNVIDPQLPAAIAAVTTAITGLQDFRMQPVHSVQTGPPAVGPTPNVPSSQYTYGSGLNIQHALAPADLYTIYDENPLLTEGINGSGITIAVVGQSDLQPNDFADVAAFRTASGLPPSSPTQVLYGSDLASAPWMKTRRS